MTYFTTDPRTFVTDFKTVCKGSVRQSLKWVQDVTGQAVVKAINVSHSPAGKCYLLRNAEDVTIATVGENKFGGNAFAHIPSWIDIVSE